MWSHQQRDCGPTLTRVKEEDASCLLSGVPGPLLYLFEGCQEVASPMFSADSQPLQTAHLVTPLGPKPPVCRPHCVLKHRPNQCCPSHRSIGPCHIGLDTSTPLTRRSSVRSFEFPGPLPIPQQLSKINKAGHEFKRQKQIFFSNYRQ